MYVLLGWGIGEVAAKSFRKTVTNASKGKYHKKLVSALGMRGEGSAWHADPWAGRRATPFLETILPWVWVESLFSCCYWSP